MRDHHSVAPGSSFRRAGARRIWVAAREVICAPLDISPHLTSCGFDGDVASTRGPQLAECAALEPAADSIAEAKMRLAELIDELVVVPKS